MKPHFKGQLERFLHNIEHNIEVQKKIDELEKEQNSKDKLVDEKEN